MAKEQDIKYATGRRKTAVARVYLSKGKGEFTINKKPLEKAFAHELNQQIIKLPLHLTKQLEKVDIKAFVKGGGLSGQAGALRLGIARSLVLFDESFRPELKKAGFLTRDPREVERKKYGLKGARARFQYSKR